MPLQWGILGTARINRSLIPPLQSSERNHLRAIASRDGSRAEEAARQWNIPQAYGSYDAVLADKEIDVVYIPLPNHLHVEWVVAAARAGKHVLCEKPLALTVAEVDRIGEEARSAGVVVAEAFMYRHHPQTLRVKEMVASGALGTVRVVRGAFTFSISREDDYRLDPARGGGSLWDVGGYPVSYTRFILGEEPRDVVGWSQVGSTGVDETFVGQLRFGSGTLVSFDCGFRAPFRTHMEIVGSDASLVVPRPFKPGMEERLRLNRGETVEEIVVPGADLYSGEIEDMADAVLLGKAPRVSLAETRGNIATLTALLRSASEGRPVEI